MGVDGAARDVSDLPSPIEIHFALAANASDDDADNSTRADVANVRCLYYNKDTTLWVTDGVSKNAAESTADTLVCSTTHLSTFGGFEDTATDTTDVTDSTTSMTGSSTTGSTGSSTTGSTGSSTTGSGSTT